MTDEHKNRSRKISVTDNIQIQRHGANCCITIINRTTGEQADLTEALLETIIQSNKMGGGLFKEYSSNDLIIEHLCHEYKEWENNRRNNRSN